MSTLYRVLLLTDEAGHKHCMLQRPMAGHVGVTRCSNDEYKPKTPF